MNGWQQINQRGRRKHVSATRSLRLPLHLLIAALVAGCTAAERPVERTDAVAHRIVSLVPAATEMLFAIGAGDEVVGVSSFDQYPPQVASLPKIGALVDPDFERILMLRPTLVVVYASQEELIARLERASIPILPYRHAIENGLADITGTMRALGERVGRGPAAHAEANRIEGELASIRAIAADLHSPETVLVLGREPGTLRGIYVSGGIGFLHDLLALVGGRNVFADVARENLQVSTETILTRAPEVIIELRASSLTPEAVETERAVWQRLASLPAVRHDRVHILADASLSIPGPRIAHAARTLFAVLHPEASQDR